MKKLLLVAALLFPQLAQASELAEQVKTLPTYNFSKVITAGGTFQTVLPIGVGRRSLTIQNTNTTDGCFITFGSINGVVITAANASESTSISLAAGQSYTRYYPYVPSDEIEGTCATSLDTLYIDTQ